MTSCKYRYHVSALKPFLQFFQDIFKISLQNNFIAFTNISNYLKVILLSGVYRIARVLALWVCVIALKVQHEIGGAQLLHENVINQPAKSHYISSDTSPVTMQNDRTDNNIFIKLRTQN